MKSHASLKNNRKNKKWNKNQLGRVGNHIYVSFTTFFSAINPEKLDAKLEVENNGTSTSKIQGEILSTCAKKGCWMELKAGKDTLMVRFKDYGFFVPKQGAEGKTAIINGEAFFDTLSVDLLQHYAEDAGKSSEEILSITEPEYVVAFTADGVIIQD